MRDFSITLFYSITLVSGARSVLLPYDTGGELNNVSARPFSGTYLDAKSVKQGSVNGRSPERSRIQLTTELPLLKTLHLDKYFLLPVI